MIVSEPGSKPMIGRLAVDVRRKHKVVWGVIAVIAVAFILAALCQIGKLLVRPFAYDFRDETQLHQPVPHVRIPCPRYILKTKRLLLQP